MKKILMAFAGILVALGLVSTFFMCSNIVYSQKLVSAIKDEDIEKIQDILEKKPECINAYPSFFSREVLYGIFDAGRVNYPLIAACCTDNAQIVKLLVESGGDVNCNDGRTPLSVTFAGKQENWYEISLYLIENGASLDYVTEYSGGHSSVLEDIVMIRAGSAKENYIPESKEEVHAAFYYAIEHCDHSKVNWESVLQDCITWDRIELVEFLLDEGYCNVNNTSRDMAPLMFAARDSTSEMVELLLERGADKNYRDSEGKTAQDYAIDSGNSEVIEMLTE